MTDDFRNTDNKWHSNNILRPNYLRKQHNIRSGGGTAANSRQRK